MAPPKSCRDPEREHFCLSNTWCNLYCARFGCSSHAVIEAPRNGGFAYGNNLGFQHGFAADRVPDFFFLLNPDTEVRTGAIRALLDFCAQRSDAGVVASSLELRNGQKWPFAFRYPNLLSELDWGLRLGLVSRLLRRYWVVRRMGNVPEQVDWFPGAAMMVRREVVERSGGMDEAYFLYYEETDFCRKVKAAGWTLWYVPASRVMHIAGQSTGVTATTKAPAACPGIGSSRADATMPRTMGYPTPWLPTPCSWRRACSARARTS